MGIVGNVFSNGYGFSNYRIFNNRYGVGFWLLYCFSFRYCEAICMSDFNWCHGPKCHTHHTVDRVRGVKGSKVLRTRKIKLNQYNKDWGTKYFCGNGCFNQFVNRNLERVVAIAPRTECLETPIKDPTKESHSTAYGYSWTTTNLEVDETRQS